MNYIKIKDFQGLSDYVHPSKGVRFSPYFYVDGKYVEYHFTGFDQQYEGIDWRSLRLVFEKDAGIWYLVGVVHGE